MKRWIQILCGICLAAGLLSGCRTVIINSEREVYAPEDPALYSDQGLEAQAYLLDGTAEHRITSDILATSRSFTISFWFKPEANFEWTTLLSMGRDDRHVMQLATSGNPTGERCGLNFSIQSGRKAERLLAAKEATVETGIYNQIVMTGSGNQIILYLNGEEVAAGNVSKQIRQLHVRDLVIGKSLFFDDPHAEGHFLNFEILGKTLSGEEVKDRFQQFYPLAVLDTLGFNDADDYTEDIWFVENPYRGLNLNWSSDKPEVISNQGKLTVPSAEMGDQAVVLTARTELAGKTFSRDFTLKVLADSERTRLKRDVKAVRNDFTALMNNQDVLPAEAENGSQIEWSVVSGNLVIEDQQLIKTGEEERTVGHLKAVVTQGAHSETLEQDVLVLDEFTGYLLCYFNGELGEERGRLAYSRDGLNWTDLNHGEPVFTSELGNGRIRDPFLGRDKNGDFVVLATQGFDTPEIYCWQSPDLIDLSSQQLIPVAFWDPFLKMSGTRAWAPEMIYDKEQDLYYLYFSDPTEKDESALYYVTTRDFKTYSYPGNFFKPGYAVIDGTIVQTQGKYWLFYKDERKAAQTIYYASSSSLADLFGKAYDQDFLFHHKFMEGPFVLKLNGEDRYYLYEDYYPYERFYVSEFSTLGEDSDLRWLADDQFRLPNEDVRHGSATGVTEKELQRILAAYGG